VTREWLAAIIGGNEAVKESWAMGLLAGGSESEGIEWRR
jgi:hypothetical protein